MIDTPTVDWLALSPTLALLAAAGVALLVGAVFPAWMRKGVAGAAALVGFVARGRARRRRLRREPDAGGPARRARWCATSSLRWRR